MQANSTSTDADAVMLLEGAIPCRVVPGGYSRVSVILAMVPLLEQLGVNLDDVLRESGLPADQFNDPENLIPFREAGRLFGICADRADCEHFGVLLGKYATLESFGIIADLVKSAPDVRSGLRLLGRYLTLSDGGGLATFSEDGQIAEWSYALYEPGVERPELVYDLCLGGLMNIMQSLCGVHWHPQEVLFSRSRPRDLKPYREFFDAPMRFDAEHTALVFKREWLDAPLTTSNPAGLLALEAQVRKMEAESTGDLPAQIRRIVRRQLLSGSTTITKVAEELAMHPRTMERRLMALQTAFRSLADEVRYEVSQQLLTTQMPIVAIAQSLQYANPAAFTRAFRRWSGAAPLRWRTRASAFGNFRKSGPINS